MSYKPSNPNGQALMASSAPVVIASNQSAVPVSGTFWQATQPVSGTVAATQSGTWTVGLSASQTLATVTNLAQLGGTAIAMGTGLRSAGTQRVTIATDDVVPASQSGTWNIGTVTTLTGITNALPAGTNNIGDVDIASIAAGTNTIGKVYITDGTNSAAVKAAATAAVTNDPAVVVAISPNNSVTVTQATAANLNATVTGTVELGATSLAALENISVTVPGTVNLGTVSLEALETITVISGTPNNFQSKIYGAVTTTAPAYTTATDNVLSLTTGGALRVDVMSALPAGTNAIGKLAANDGVDIGDVTINNASIVVTQGTAANLNATVSIAASQTLSTVTTVSTVTNLSQLGGTAIAMGSGVRSTGTQRVTIATDDIVPVSQSGTWNIGTLTGITNALPAGTNNIGDVDVLSVVPGTGATNLGKQTDSAAGATDTGVAILGIRTDSLVTLTPAVGDYTRFRVNSVGRLWTSATIDAALPAGTNAIGSITNTSFAVTQATAANLNATVSIAASQTLSTVTTVSTVTNLAQLGGTAISMNTGVRDAGTQRVTIATNDSVPVTGPLTDTQLRATAVPVSGTVAATQSGTWTVQPGNTANTTPWLIRHNESLGTATVLASLNAVIAHALVGNLGASAVITAISAPTGIVLTPQVSYDGGTNYVASSFYDVNTAIAVATINTFSVGASYVITAGDGATHVRVVATSWTSGSVTVRISSSNAQGLVNLRSSAVHDLSAGTFTQLVSGFASSTTPTAVGAGDAARIWTTLNGAVNIADGGGSITVDGTVAATQSGTWNIGSITTLPALATGANVIGAVTQSGAWNIGTVSTVTNLSQLGGTAIAMGTGVRGAGVQRVTIATDDVVPASQSGTWTVGLSASQTLATVTTVGAVTSITNALPAGTNAIGKLAANSGVDIGDVDVLSIVPGTGATNLGKQTDSAAGATDTGVAVLAIRTDTLATLTPAVGDYTRFRVNSVGRLWTSATIDAALPTGANVIGAVTQSGTWNIGSITTLPALATGTNTIGAVNIAASQTLATVTTVSTLTNQSQMGGQAISMGTGVRDAGTQRVTIATNDSVPVTGTVAAIQSGTWTVQPGNTANTTPWLVKPAESLGTATALGALNAEITHALGGNLGAAVTVTATSVPSGIVLTAYASYDGGTNWTVTQFFNSVNGDAINTLSTFAVGDAYSISAGDGATHVKVRATSWTSGSVTVRISSTNSQGLVNLKASAVHDEVAGSFVLQMGAVASSTAPTAVSANGDAVRLWATTNGALNIADGGGSVTVDGTFWQATQPVSIASVPSHPVTNAGTFAVQVSSALPAGTNAIGSITNTSFAATQSGTWNIGTVTTLSQFAGQAINLGAGTTGTGTLRTITASSATGTQTNPSLSTVSATLLAANTNRTGASVFNNSAAIVYVRLSATAASTTTFTIKLQPDDYYEVPSNYNGAITAILNTGTTAAVQVTEIT